VALSTDDGQTTSSLHLRRQLDISTTTSHVGGDGDGGRLTSESYDVSLFLVQLSVQHLTGDMTHVEHLLQQFGYLNGGCTHQNGATSLTHLHNLVDDRIILLASRLVDAVVHIVTDHGLVGRNLNNIQLIDVPELASLRRSGTRHTSQLVVHAEVVLQRDGGKGLSSSLDLHVLLSLDSLVQAIAPATTFHDTTCLLVDNLYLTVDDHIFVVLVEHAVGLQQLLQGVDTLRLHCIVLQHLVFLVDTLLVRE